jgi:hypothetical protein
VDQLEVEMCPHNNFFFLISKKKKREKEKNLGCPRGWLPKGLGVVSGDWDSRQCLENCPSKFFDILTIHFHPTATNSPHVQINIK